MAAPVRTAVWNQDQRGWRQAAACGEIDPNLFFPVGTTGAATEETERAKAVCATCSVTVACLHFALATNQEFGVWGGRDEGERRLLLRQMRASNREPTT